MAREIGVGVVGLGWMGRLHSRAYRRLLDHYPECALSPRLLVAADAVEDRARENAGRLGYEGWTTDWREVVEHPGVEAVSITAPNHLHREVAVAAARAGKHIWLEKPCGRVPAETEDIGRAVEEAGVKSMIGLMYRHAPAVEYAREIIAAGELGEITHYRGFFLADYASDPNGALTWRFKEEFGGLGVLGDIMPHAADMAQNLLGPISCVSAQRETFIRSRPEVPMGASHFALVEGGELGPVENEDYVGCLVRFENGARGMLETSRTCVGPHVRMSFEVNGTRGALSWDFQRLNELELYRSDAKGEEGYRTVFARPGMGDFGNFQPGAGIPMGYDDLKVAEAERFLSSIADGRQREPGIREIVSTMRVVDAMDRSCDSGRWEAVGGDGAGRTGDVREGRRVNGAGRRGLDLVCIGRTSVDLYAEQEGARLEDVQSFRKYVGGSATNIAVGTARLGVKSAMLTRVGDEHMGRFVRRNLAENGVDVGRVRFDPEHLTPYVLLAVRAIDDFPRIFAYGDAADLAVEEDDVEEDFIASSRALLVTGTPLSRPGSRAACFKAIRAAREAGTGVVFDLDYRPVFWGLASHEQGGEMFVASEEVTEVYRSVLPGCDLVVGTEDEIRIAGGSTAVVEALRSIRGLSVATIVLKVGAMGAVVFPGEIPDDVEDGVRVPGFPVEVFNSVGAGDAFLSGFLSGWLREEPLEECLRLGNACGAIVVSRHGCSPAMPTREELEYFLALEEKPRRLRDDGWLNHIHRATTREEPEELRVLAVDHRWQLEEVADGLGVDRGRLRELKVLLGRAFRRVAEDDSAAGVLLDDVYGDRALEELTGSGAWIARAVELAGSRPVQFAGGPNVAATLRSWPEEHVVKCNLYMHPEDDAGIRQIQERRVLELFDACVANDRRLLLEIQAAPEITYDGDSVAGLLRRFYEIGVRPEWWKIPPNPDPAVWERIGSVVREQDPYCAGLLVLGQAMEEGELAESFAAAASEPLCRGFAIGRSIYGDPGRRWLAGEMEDEELVSSVAERYRRMNDLWQSRNERPTREDAAG